MFGTGTQPKSTPTLALTLNCVPVVMDSPWLLENAQGALLPKMKVLFLQYFWAVFQCHNKQQGIQGQATSIGHAVHGQLFSVMPIHMPRPAQTSVLSSRSI